jgi:dinuclear metal center YbgI/SA1388 family protein
MNTTIGELINYLHEIAPNNLQEEYDNSGLLVGNKNTQISGVLISLDCTEDIIEEAKSLNCNVIVSHHPIVFRGLKRFTGENYVQRTIISAIKNDISLFAIHTNLDKVRLSGVNTKIAEKIGLEQLEIMAPETEDLNVGLGMVGQLPSPQPLAEFLAHLKQSMQLDTFKYTQDIGRPIKKVAVCGGSGSSLLTHAKIKKADVYITSDFKYHEFFDAEKDIVIADIGHYESERFTIDLLYDLISNKFSTFAAHCTKINTNPVKYF